MSCRGSIIVKLKCYVALLQEAIWIRAGTGSLQALKVIVTLAVLISGFQMKMRNQKVLFFFHNRNICCGNSNEPSQFDGYFENTNHMLGLLGMKIISI